MMFTRSSPTSPRLMPSPSLADARRRAERRLAVEDRAIEAAVLDAMDVWLAAARALIIADAAQQLGVTAAAGWGRQRRLGRAGKGGIGKPMRHPTPAPADAPLKPQHIDPAAAVQAATGAYNDWRRSIENNVLPAVSIAFGDAFQQHRLANRDRGSFTPQMQYMEQVADRLKIWPDGAFEELRPELIEALAQAETIEQVTDRVGWVLGIDADQRAIKARINEVEAALADPDGYGLDAEDRAELRAERRLLWEAHDAEETQWRWKARRIARTEAHGAVNAGQLAAARQNQDETGDRYFKRWVATEDPRTRASHRVADGQSVPLDEKFRVGGFMLDFPGDPIVIAPHEVINCRCTMMMWHPDALQDALQGPDGSVGEVRPEGVRIGPDDGDRAQEAIEKVIAEEHLSPPPDVEDRGEDHGQPSPGDPEDVDLVVEREAPVGPVPDLASFTDEQLLELAREKIRSDDGVYEAAIAEYDRRLDAEGAQ